MFEIDCLIAFVLVKCSQLTAGQVVCRKYWQLFMSVLEQEGTSWYPWQQSWWWGNLAADIRSDDQSGITNSSTHKPLDSSLFLIPNKVHKPKIVESKAKNHIYQTWICLVFMEMKYMYDLIDTLYSTISHFPRWFLILYKIMNDNY